MTDEGLPDAQREAPAGDAERGSASAQEAARPRRRFLAQLKYIEPIWLLTAMAVVLIVTGVIVALSIVGLPQASDGWASLPEDASVTVNLAGYFPAEGEAPLAKPLGIALLGSRVYVAESDAARVAIFDVRGRRTGEIVLEIAEGADLAVPTVLAPAGSRRLAVLDAAAGQVLVYDVPWLWSGPGLDFRIGEGDPATAPVRPTAVAYDAGSFYVADAESASIKVYDDEGTFVREIGADFESPLGYVGGMVVSGDRLVLAESGSDRVLSLDPVSGTEPIAFPDAYALPRGVCSVGDGVAVTAVLGGGIYVCGPNGARTHVIDAETVPAWPPSGPEGAAFHERNNRLFVTEPDFGRVVVFNVRM